MPKPVRWSRRALDNLRDREIDSMEADLTATFPDAIGPADPPRQAYMRRYFDTVLQQDMLLRIIVEETPQELVVVTAYKTSKIIKYLKGPTP